MPSPHTVLLVGGTGRTGRRVMQHLLGRGVRVRAIVRSAGSLDPEVVRNPDLTVMEASLLQLTDAQLQQQVNGCDAVISCLGHVLSLKGVFGPPHDLVTRATARLCRAIETLEPAAPTRFILMTGVSVNRTDGLDTLRNAFERTFLRVLCAVLPPADDNQRAADVLQRTIGPSHRSIEWCVVRPDTLLPDEVSAYTLHEGIVNGLFAPGSTNMANIAHFMCELVTDATAWKKWRSKLPVIVNAVEASVE